MCATLNHHDRADRPRQRHESQQRGEEGRSKNERNHEGDQGQHTKQDAGAFVPQLHSEGDLSGLLIRGDVPDVVGQIDRRGDRTHRHSAGHAHPCHREHLGELGAQYRHEAEEDEHSDLTQAAVAVRVLPAGVEPRREDAHRANEDEPRFRRQNQHQASKTGDTKRDEGCPLDVLRAGFPRGGEACWARAVIVGAAHAVGIVIRVVHTNDEPHGHNECQEGLWQAPPELIRRRTSTHHHGGHGVEPGMRAGCLPPIAKCC